MDLFQTPLVRSAAEFASRAHSNIAQLRKYTDEPYITHPVSVARIVSTVPHTEVMLAAALLHDTVEDTGVTLDQIRAEFGEPVAVLVGWLTDVSRPEHGSRAIRKAIDRAHSALSCPEAKTIKLADIIDNTQSIVAHDPGFARVYLPENVLLLDVLREGNRLLWERANDVVQHGLKIISVKVSP